MLMCNKSICLSLHTDEPSSYAQGPKIGGCVRILSLKTFTEPTGTENHVFTCFIIHANTIYLNNFGVYFFLQ